MMNDEFLLELEACAKESLPMRLTAEQVKELYGELNPPEEPSEAIVAEEAEPKTELKGSLPDDFPGRSALADAGINTYAQVRKQRDSKDGLMGVTGVGDVTAGHIEEALEG